MVAFETLLLGLVIGHIPIRLMVSPPAATVELRLDGAAIGTLRGPPWEFEFDFGPNLMPHWLTAVAFDPAGKEVGRASRPVNLGGKRTNVSLLLERAVQTQPPNAVRVAWNATTVGATSPVVRATLDGTPLPVRDPHRIAIPAIDLGRPHLVSVEVSFSETLRDRADVVLGGDVAETAGSDLTAIAVTSPPEKEPLDVGQLRGVFSVGSTSLDPVAVDCGRAEVAVVLSPEAKGRLAANWRLKQDDARAVNAVLSQLAGMQKPPSPDADVFFLVTAVPNWMPEAGMAFAMGRQTRLSWLREPTVLESLAGFTAPNGPPHAGALAVAGAEVAASNHRRAVVLVLAEEGKNKKATAWVPDGGTLGVTSARAYLDALHVPLVVWSLTGELSAGLTATWGRAEDVSNWRRMGEAASRLESQLGAQRIVWFPGRHLPQRITLDESRTAVRFAR